jgi:hypothetical protein
MASQLFKNMEADHRARGEEFCLPIHSKLLLWHLTFGKRITGSGHAHETRLWGERKAFDRDMVMFHMNDEFRRINLERR